MREAYTPPIIRALRTLRKQISICVMTEICVVKVLGTPLAWMSIIIKNALITGNYGNNRNKTPILINIRLISDLTIH